MGSDTVRITCITLPIAKEIIKILRSVEVIQAFPGAIEYTSWTLLQSFEGPHEALMIIGP